MGRCLPVVKLPAAASALCTLARGACRLRLQMLVLSAMSCSLLLHKALCDSGRHWSTDSYSQFKGPCCSSDSVPERGVHANPEVWYRGMGKPGEAEPLCRRALDIYEHKCGRSSPYVATALQALSEVLKELSRWGWSLLSSVRLGSHFTLWASTPGPTAGTQLAHRSCSGRWPPQCCSACGLLLSTGRRQATVTCSSKDTERLPEVQPGLACEELVVAEC